MKIDPNIIQNLLEREYPVANCALTFSSDWQLLVAVQLSAQCTDVRVNKVTPALFKKYPNVEDVERMEIDVLKKYIHSAGFYNNKAINIKGAAHKIVKDFGGKVPDNMNDLLTLPGIGRKSANVILSEWYKKNEGIVVDTHVLRLVGRIGMSSATTPESIETDLIKFIPRKNWRKFSLELVFHGRNVCKARKPNCEVCVLNKVCKSAFKI